MEAWKGHRAGCESIQRAEAEASTPRPRRVEMQEIWVLFTESCGTSDHSSLTQQSQLGL